MRFDQAFEIVVGHEGGYVNDPQDPGGETKFGISKASYPNLDIAALTIEQATEIYRKDYWQAARCDDFPELLRLPLFDSTVNQGLRGAITLLQEILRVDVDGIIGPKTLNAALKADARELVLDFFSYRALKYVNTRNFDRFGRGWMRRMFSIAMELNTTPTPSFEQKPIAINVSSGEPATTVSEKPAPQTPKGKPKIVNADYLAFRNSPGGQGQPIILQKGLVLNTLESMGDWERVSIVTEGWVAKKYLV